MTSQQPTVLQEAKNNASGTVVKALHVLEVLTKLNERSKDGASLTEISKACGISPSSTYKHLAAFLQYGIVDQNPRSERYRLGLQILKMADIIAENLDIRDIAAPILRELSVKTGETIHLVLIEGTEVIYIDKVEPEKSVRMHSRIGARNPLYCTGVGKAILAFSSEDLLHQVAKKPFTAFTATTHQSIDSLKQDLIEIKKRGFAIDEREHEADVRCVAAPVFNRHSEVSSAISISAPAWRMTDDRIEEWSGLLIQSAEKISNRY